ncbi:MAG: Ig-like domain-containing protein, partial [Pirellulales bacterium]|nr:Ig-like domain-containing protein [Pirellulales bacterium]
MLVEGLEQRQLLAGDTLPLIDPATLAVSPPRNIGTVPAVQFVESETTGQIGLNDSIVNAEVVPLGNGVGQQDTIDITGGLSFRQLAPGGVGFESDVDVFAVDLQAGDILDIATVGAATGFTVFDSNGQIWYGVDTPQVTYPLNSPLQTAGNAAFAQVIPQDGRYYIEVVATGTGTAYTMGLRTYRPIVEQLPVGVGQALYIDFDGGSFPRDIFNLVIDPASPLPIGGTIRIPSLQQSLPSLGIQVANQAALDSLLRSVINQVEDHFAAVAINGSNGDFESTGGIGDYGITILNSVDHPDPGDHPLVTRVVVGGTAADFGFSTVGIAQSVDVGNFDLSEAAVVLMDGIAGLATLFPVDPSASILDVAARGIAAVVSHEAGHVFGLRHTDGANFTSSLIDEGGPPQSAAFLLGVGSDGIFGTIDDTEIDFTTDTFSLQEGIFGTNFSAEALSHGLGTGTVGGAIAGRVFNDANGDGGSLGDVGLPGVLVFADVNNNGVQDSFEPSALSGADGSFSLTAVAGTYPVIAITPAQFAATTASSQTLTVAAAGVTSGIEFGFEQVIADITGTTFSDDNGNGIRDPGEGGVAGIFHYLDLDGDNRPDLGEPNSTSGPDGTYNINFPGPGTFTVRQLVPPGFAQTSPVSGEHNVVFNGQVLANNFDFGLLPSRDFGDAPDSFGTTLAAGGANHGILEGLSIGAVVDSELDGQPSVLANGDDVNGRVLQSGLTEDDEDGVVLLEPLSPGVQSSFQVTVNNTTGIAAFLQGFMDFNGDGDFNDPGEQFLTDVLVPNGAVGLVLDADDGITVDVPADAALGDTYARFRLSQDAGLGPVGAANAGEVEDYLFPILGTGELANDDAFSVSRNSLANQLDVLANDFETLNNPLTIINVDTSQTTGVVTPALDLRSVFYTPQNGFIGQDQFTYTVRDTFGTTAMATVTVNVNFQSDVPIALDDSFEVPAGSSNRPLNVLDNDIPSVFGGLQIVSVSPGSAGGSITLVGGGQSLLYTPLPGFAGTEQFTYSIQDGNGSVDSAE